MRFFKDWDYAQKRNTKFWLKQYLKIEYYFSTKFCYVVLAKIFNNKFENSCF